MAYNEEAANRIRLALLEREIEFAEKRMMGGLCFMVDEKMCLGTHIDKRLETPLLMVRIGAAAVAKNADRLGALPMDFTGRPMKDYLFISSEGLVSDADFKHWVDLALAFNPLAKASKQKKRK